MLDPQNPLRQIYFQIIGQESENLENFVQITIVDNMSVDAMIRFTKSQLSTLDTFQVVICYSYAAYSNLADLCDTQ